MRAKAPFGSRGPWGRLAVLVVVVLAAANPLRTATPTHAAQPTGTQVPPEVTSATGPFTAWCAPGQTLLGGGFELTLGEEDGAGGAPQHVAISRPTARYDVRGALVQRGWTAVPSTLDGPHGPLMAYALCAGPVAPVAAAEPLPPPPGVATPPPPPPALPQLDAMAVVERVGPAVVTVITKQGAGDGASADAQPAASGSGFFVDAAGYLVTNEHVVRDGDAFEVVLADGSERTAELVGADRTSDLAVLRVAGDAPAVASLGDSDALRPGQPVLALGSPLGTFTNTVTDGIVGGLGRAVPEAGAEVELVDLIQHNAAINPGNSGGPLVTLAGEVVGVNTMGFFDTQGLFFAVPTRTVVRVATQLVASGRVIYPYLGVEALPLDDVRIGQYDLPVEDGAYVQRVVPDGPAAQAGIAPGDIVVAVDGEPVGERRSLTGVLFAHAPGETVVVTVQRGTVALRLPVTLAERPSA